MGFKNVIGKIFSPEDEEVQTYASAEVEVDPAPEYQTNNRTEPATPSYAQEQQPAATAPKRETVARAADSSFELKVVKP
ncbi:MAG: hypothetical protein IKB23_03210, partial [Clostridia bacterium]|nr:hypothetical protein [Clostridia bacterium]